MSTIKIGGKLPKDVDANGLDDGGIYATLVRDPHRAHIVVAVVDTAKIVKDILNADTIPTLRIRAIELIGGDDAGRLRAMLQRRHEERTGNLELPGDWEEVFASFAAPKLPGSETGT